MNLAFAPELSYSLDSGGGGISAKEQQRTLVAEVAHALDSHHGRLDLNQQEMIVAPDVTPTLPAYGGPRGTTNNPQFNDHALVAAPLTDDPYADRAAEEGNLIAHALRAEGADASEDGTGRGTPLVAIQDARGMDKGQNGLGVSEDGVAYTLDGIGSQGVAYAKSQRAHHADDCERWEEAEAAPTLDSLGHAARTATAVAQQGMSVRRLTPTECERLQGFPDGWTDGESDSARYRMLGNAVCVPVAAWIAQRLVIVDRGGDPNA